MSEDKPFVSQLKSSNTTIRLDWLSKNCGFFYTVNEVLESFQTKYQTLDLVNTNHFGKALLLDGATQVVEKGEEYYHEPLTHYALLRVPESKLKKVLIIGGGDGGILREVLRHETIDLAYLLEIDTYVMQYCKQHFPAISNGAFENKKCRLIIEDAFNYVSKETNKMKQAPSSFRTFDAVVMDMTDPVGPSKKLYTKPFFEKIKSLLSPNGVFAMHAESFYFAPSIFKSIVYTLQQVFNNVAIHSIYIPMYGAVWNIAVCIEGSSLANVDKDTISKRFINRKLLELKAINVETFFASMVYPPLLKEALDFTKDMPKILDTEEDIVS